MEFTSYLEVERFVESTMKSYNELNFTKRENEILLLDLNEAKRYIRRNMNMLMTSNVFDTYDNIIFLMNYIQTELELIDLL